MMIKSTSHFFPVLFLLALIPLLSGCDLYEEGHMSQNRIQIEEEHYSERIPVAALNEKIIKSVAKRYDRHGDGPLNLIVLYDPKSSSNTAMKANNEVLRLEKNLRSLGVNKIEASILPVHKLGGDSEVVVSYTSYNAHAPKDCGLLEGYDTTELTLDESYKIGCTVDTIFAKQIARPKDLKGQVQTETTSDGRRGSNVIENYRTGEPRESLDGENASGGN